MMRSILVQRTQNRQVGDIVSVNDGLDGCYTVSATVVRPYRPRGRCRACAGCYALNTRHGLTILCDRHLVRSRGVLRLQHCEGQRVQIEFWSPTSSDVRLATPAKLLSRMPITTRKPPRTLVPRLPDTLGLWRIVTEDSVCHDARFQVLDREDRCVKTLGS
ncbi:hypothetical protein BC628DRAFT_292951 [Trametes gibbosa]|nr:hypothetical protein BC628DRAFT_292951 [Trametes gibbosa]